MVSAPTLSRTYGNNSLPEFEKYVKSAHLEDCEEIFQRTKDFENQ